MHQGLDIDGVAGASKHRAKAVKAQGLPQFGQRPDVAVIACRLSAPGGLFLDRLSRFDVAEYNGVKMVVVESDLLPPDPAVVVILLLAGHPAVKDLNPKLLHDGKRWVLATRLMAAVRRSSLRRAGSVADQGDHIVRAVDVLMAGV